MKYSLFKKISVSLLVFLFVPLLVVFAQNGNVPNPGSNPTGNVPSSGTSIENPLKGGANGQGINNVYDLVKFIVNDIILPFGATIMVLMIIFAGFQFVVAQGNPKKIEDAKTTLLYAVIGSAILLGSWAIAEIIQNTVKSITG